VRALDVYQGSDGEATKALYADLEKCGPIGVVALNLFRAQKCSARAKMYRGHRFKDAAYERKNWSMGLLCDALMAHAAELRIRWGWEIDRSETFAPYVLYVELPQGQVSFHARVRGRGPDFAGKWDGATGASSIRIVSFCESVLGGGVLAW